MTVTSDLDEIMKQKNNTDNDENIYENINDKNESDLEQDLEQDLDTYNKPSDNK